MQEGQERNLNQDTKAQEPAPEKATVFKRAQKQSGGRVLQVFFERDQKNELTFECRIMWPRVAWPRLSL